MFKTRSPLPFIIVMAIVIVAALVFFFVIMPALGTADVSSTGDVMTWSWHVDF